jgi:hypothetical protein
MGLRALANVYVFLADMGVYDDESEYQDSEDISVGLTG